MLQSHSQPTSGGVACRASMAAVEGTHIDGSSKLVGVDGRAVLLRDQSDDGQPLSVFSVATDRVTAVA